MLCYAEMKHSDWLKDAVAWLGTANQRALFQYNYATLKFVYGIQCHQMLDFNVAQKYSPKLRKSVRIIFYSQSDDVKIANKSPNIWDTITKKIVIENF